MERLYKCKEIADMYGVSVRTVWEWIKSGKLKAYRIGRLYRIYKEDLEQFKKSGSKGDA